MAKKRTSLDELFTKETETAPAPQPTTPPRRSSEKQKTSLYLHPAVYEQLRTLAFEERHHMNDYLIEGLSLVFKNRGLKSVEELIQRSRES